MGASPRNVHDHSSMEIEMAEVTHYDSGALNAALQRIEQIGGATETCESLAELKKTLIDLIAELDFERRKRESKCV